MFKMFCALAIVTTFMASSAMARGRGCCCNAYSSAPAAQPAAPEKAPAAPAPQAQAPQATRSFSYAPSTTTQTYQSTGRGYGLRYDPKIEGTWGRRPASDKLIGNY